MKALWCVCTVLLSLCQATTGQAADLRALESFFEAQAFRPSIPPTEAPALTASAARKPAIAGVPAGRNAAPAYNPDERIVMAFESASGAD